MKRLSETCATLYADLKDRACGDTGRLPPGGAFTKKTVNGGIYWYYQTPQVDGQRRQISLGRESDELLAKIDQWRTAQSDSAGLSDARKRLVAMLGVGGAHLEPGRPAKLLSRMSQAGLFDAGGVLVGSFAFACYGNMLGVSFGSALMRTSDMDFSLERELDIGLQRSIPDDLRLAEPALKWPPQLLPSAPPFNLIAPDGFKVEFLTAQHAATERTPVLIERFSVHAMPLPYMDYLLNQTQDAVVLNGAGIPVKVPDPARFALHKLAVSQLRPVGEKTKSDKDIRQAEQLLEVLLADNPGSAMLAADAANEREDLLGNLILKGASRLPPEMRESLRGWVLEKVWDAELGKAIPGEPQER